MRVNIDLDNDLIEKALKYSGLKTKNEVIHKALDEFVKYQMRIQMIALQGKVNWEGDLKKMRTYDKWEGR